MVSKNILIVEDEINLGNTLFEYLNSQNYECKLARTIEQGSKLFKDSSYFPSIALLDINLPDGNGMDLAREIRKKNKKIVIFFLSALNDPETRLQGLEIGADDYITKPFNIKELNLRLERILNNLKEKEELPEVINHGKLKIWFKRYEISDANNKIIVLSQKECALLEVLYKNMNNVVPRNQMIDFIWGENSFPSSRTIDNYVVKLRKWCETDPSHPIEIQSIRGVGYKLILKEKK